MKTLFQSAKMHYLNVMIDRKEFSTENMPERVYDETRKKSY